MKWIRKKKEQRGRRRGIDTAENDSNQIALRGFGDSGRKGDWRRGERRYQLEFSGGQTVLERQSFQSHWLRCINIGLCCIFASTQTEIQRKEHFYPELQEGKARQGNFIYIALFIHKAIQGALQEKLKTLK